MQPTCVVHLISVSLWGKYVCISVFYQYIIGEGNGSPLQCSCLENPMDRGAWGLQSMGSQRVERDLATKQHLRPLQKLPQKRTYAKVIPIFKRELSAYENCSKILHLVVGRTDLEKLEKKCYQDCSLGSLKMHDRKTSFPFLDSYYQK